MDQLDLPTEQRVERMSYPEKSLLTIRIGCIRQPSPTPSRSDSSGQSRMSASRNAEEYFESRSIIKNFFSVEKSQWNIWLLQATSLTEP